MAASASPVMQAVPVKVAAAAPAQDIPGIAVVPTPEDISFYWPDFGVAADQGVYGVQFRQADGSWATMTTDTLAYADDNPEGPQNVDRWVRIGDVQPDDAGTARIVSAPTAQDIFDTTEDADPAAPPTNVLVSQPLPFQIPRYAASAGNPGLSAKCGLDFALVLDASASIDSTALRNLKSAADSFVDGLADTGSHVSQVSFAVRSPGAGGSNRGPTALSSANVAAIKGSYANLQTTGNGSLGTNWQDGLRASQQLFTFPPPPGTTAGAPDLMIVITDGNPNTINTANGGTRLIQPDGDPAAVNPAISIANQIKGAGTHIFVVGVGSQISEAPIKAISGTERLAADGSNFATAGYTTTRDYATLAQTLREITVELCAPSLTITKQAQRPGSTDYVPADGWTFSTSVRLNGGSGAWVNPGTDAIPADTYRTKSQVTSNSGAANFQWRPSGDITSSVRIREVAQPGFTRQDALVCRVRNALTNASRTFTVQADANGVWDSTSVGNNGLIGSREMVTCTAQNSLDFASLSVVKDAAGSPQDFGFTGAVTQALVTPDSRFPSTFTLDDDPGSATPKQRSWDQLSPGTYVIAEDALPAGWSLRDIALAGSGQLTKDLVNRRATIVLAAGDDATVTFTNRSASTLTVTKRFTWPAGLTIPAGFAFTIPVDCSDNAFDQDVVFSKADIDGGNLTRSISGVPLGTVCTVSESAPPAIPGWTWADPVISPTSGTVTIAADPTQNTVVVTNAITEDFGYFEILKVFDPGQSGFAGTFTGRYACSNGQRGDVTLVAGTPVVVGPLKAGTQCTVTEPTLPAAPAGWRFGTPTITNSPITIVRSTQASPGGRVSVTNTIFRPALTLVKTADRLSVSQVGETITYTFTATNTGDVSLSAVSVSDPLAGLSALSCTPAQPAVLTPGEKLVCTASYTVTLADLNAGAVFNTATATGTPPTGPPLTPGSSVAVPVTRTPAMTLVKTADKTSVATVGDVIHYTFTASNTGNQTLTAVSISDPLPGLSALSCTPGQPAALAPGETLVCTASYAVTQADLDAGAVTNTATATGTPPTGPPLTPGSTVRVPASRTPGLALAKTANTSSVSQVGEKITYTLTATNTGNVSLSAVSVSDPLAGLSALSCAPAQPAVLAPGGRLVCTATYTVTQADLDAGGVTNTATGTGTPPGGKPLQPSLTLHVPATQTPGLAFTKTADRTSVAAVGDVIHYTFTATNTGNQTLTAVSISDPLVGLSPLSCTPGQPAVLVPGGQLVCTANYTVTQDDLDAGAVLNTATATGTPPGGKPPFQPTSTMHVPAARTPDLSLVKTADKASVSTVGEVIGYTFTATNTGNLTLTAVSISDPLPGLSPLSCSPAQPAVLAPGEKLVCSASYAVTQADVDAGAVFNTATATGQPPTGPPLTPHSTVGVPVARTPDLTLVKTADTSSVSTLGELIGYTFTATNTGNQTLTAVSISDPLPGLSALSCTPAQPSVLAPGEKLVCTASYAVTQADLDAGAVFNTATATGQPPTGPPLTPRSSVGVPVLGAPDLSLVKTANRSSVSTVGDTIGYTFTATNTGNQTLSGVSISDPLAGLSALSCAPGQPAVLAPGEQLVCTATYVVTQADLDAGAVVNGATATGEPPTGPPLTPHSSVRVPVAQTPNLSLVKAADKKLLSQVGETIGYTFTATNTGNQTLTGVSISDPLVGLSPLSCTPAQPAVLAPGERLVCTASYTVTQADLDAGAVFNAATATGQPPTGPPLRPRSIVGVPVARTPDLRLVKTADKISVSAVGDTIGYTLTATNTGNQTLTGVSISDPLVGLSPLSCTPAQPAVLAPGETLVCTASYALTQADVDAGAVFNAATATGQPPTGPPLRPRSIVGVPVARTPDLSLVKTADKSVLSQVGEVVGYTLTATNTGNQTLTGVSISDPLVGLSPLSCTPGQPAVLAPGEKLVCTASYTVTQADVDAGAVFNVVTATGQPPTGPPLTPRSSVGVPVSGAPNLSLVKTADTSSVSTLGETITYTLSASNTGNQTLSGVSISDPLAGLSALSCTPGQPAVLAPGETLACSASYVVTQADLDAGAVVNGATATGQPPTGPPLTPHSSVRVPVAQTPNLTLVKAADKTSVSEAGETITYTFTATNTGNQTLSGVSISDPLAGLSALSCAPAQPAVLAPGEKLVCTASYTVTQADLDAGAVFNAATGTGIPPTGNPLRPHSTVGVPVARTPDLSLVKTADRSSVSAAGDTIGYTFTATNTGNQTLSGVSISDPLPGLSPLSCSPAQPAVLAPGEKLVCTASYTVTQADVDTGAVFNTATATGQPPTGPPLRPRSIVGVPAIQTPGLTLVKTADKSSVNKVGETITYTLTATNTGNVSLSAVTITDPLVGLSALACVPAQPAVLAPGEQLVCTAHYRVTRAAASAGRVVNTATVTGRPPIGPPLDPWGYTIVVQYRHGTPPDHSPSHLSRTGLPDWTSPVGATAALMILLGGLMVHVANRRGRRGTR